MPDRQAHHQASALSTTPASRTARSQGRFRDIQDFVYASRQFDDLQDLRESVEDTAARFGIRYFLLSHHVNIASPKIVRLSNYPEDWREKMRAEKQFSVDPVVRACQRTATPFLWSELDRLIRLSPTQHEILEGAARAGLGAGFTVPIHIPGECTGSGSFATDSGHDLDASIVPTLQYLASFAFEAARRLCLKADRLDDALAAPPVLTQRQLDCLVLIAQGKSDWDVGQILGISHRTVQEHVDTARKHYGVGSRTQLIIRTLFDNQIGFQDVIRT